MMSFVHNNIFGENDSELEDLQFVKEQVDAYVVDQGFDLASADLGWYYGLCFILRKYTKKELSPSTIMAVFDKADTTIRKPSIVNDFPIDLRRFAIERLVSAFAREESPNLSQYAKENLAICFWIVYGRILGDEEQPCPAEAFKLFKRIDVEAIDRLKAKFYINGWIPDWERAGH